MLKEESMKLPCTPSPADSPVTVQQSNTPLLPLHTAVPQSCCSAAGNAASWSQMRWLLVWHSHHDILIWCQGCHPAERLPSGPNGLPITRNPACMSDGNVYLIRWSRKNPNMKSVIFLLNVWDKRASLCGKQGETKRCSFTYCCVICALSSQH